MGLFPPRDSPLGMAGNGNGLLVEKHFKNSHGFPRISRIKDLDLLIYPCDP